MTDATQIILVLSCSFVGVVIFLTLFFKAMRHFDSKGVPNTDRIKLRGVIDETTRVTVHLSNGTVFEDVILVGFTRNDSVKDAFPYELTGMSILEHRDGSKKVIQSKLIRMIEVPKSEAASNNRAEQASDGKPDTAAS